MAVEDLYAEIVRIRPKEGAEPRLLEMRDEMVDWYRVKFPGFVSARLLRPEDGGTWVDLWYWRSKGEAEEALADTSNALFQEWGTLVDMVQFEWAEVLTDN